jgi:hypothetical protein
VAMLISERPYSAYYFHQSIQTTIGSKRLARP